MALPLGDFSDPLAVQAIEPQITEATPGEVLGATAGAAFDSLPTVRGMGATARSFADGLPISQGDGSYVSSESMGLPAPVMLQPEEATAKVKAAGAPVTFDKPTSAASAQSIIDQHLTDQQRADVIARNGNSILSGQAGRFVAGSLISLADPINVAAMMIPAAPEAFVAEKLAAAAGVFERTAIRGAAGAVNGAVGMAALEPLNYAMSKSDYNDWSAGDALRNIFMGAALGAGGHMLLGGLFGDGHAAPGREHLTPGEANTSMEATRAAIGQAAEGRPVDVGAIPEASDLTRAADDLQAHTTPFADGIDAFHGTPHEFSSFHTDNIGTGEGAQSFGHGLYFAENEGVARSYRDKLSPPSDTKILLADKTPLNPDSIEYQVANLIDTGGYPAAENNVRTWMKLGKYGSEWGDALEALKGKTISKPEPSGNLYKVKLNARPEELLDWDKPLSEQPEIAAKLRAGGIAFDPSQTGGDLIRHEMGPNQEMDPAQHSQFMADAGIKGIRYLDGDSRAAGDGFRNIVMFDHNDVQITHKNGVPVAQAAADLRAQADTAAKGMAERAMNPPADPVLDQAAKVNKATLDAAPQLAGTAIDKDLAEVTKLTQDLHQQLQQEIASGRINETQEMKDVMIEADHIENVGKASANYAACLVGKGLT